MAARSYAVSPSDLDEDGNAVDTPSYNEYGDYVLYRPDAVDDTPIYGLPVDYMAPHYISWCGAVCMVRCCFGKRP